MFVRAIRGATTAEENTKESILEATRELLEEIVNRNNLNEADIISVLFTVTSDLNATFPAIAARYIGWTDIALICTNEIYVPGSLNSCVRAMVHINTDKRNCDIRHVYLKGAAVLRPDLSGNSSC
jgi:chorismate mutase